MIKKVLVYSLIFISIALNAQKHTISGYIEDASSGERLISATVYDDISKKGCITNVYGFYSLTLNEGPIKLVFSYVGFNQEFKEIELSGNVSLNIKLNPTITLQEAIVSDTRTETNTERVQMSAVELPIQTIKSLPVFLGEVDIIKTIQLLPGVQSGSEGSSGLYVRGGGPDQNLILLDGVPVYNADHLFGFFSVFNADAIQNVTLIKGGFPARYGGRLSSVLDIRMKEGNNREFKGEGSIGLISSKFTFEGPLEKEKSSFIFSGRRTYIDILAQPLIRALSDGNSMGYYFYDFNLKVNYTFSDKDRIYLSVYNGRDKAYGKAKYSSWDYDKYESTNKFGLSWGNTISAFRWNRMITNKLFMNTTATYSNYNFNVSNQYTSKQITNNKTNITDYKYSYLSGIHDWAGKIDFDYHPSPSHKIMFGASNTYHTFSPGMNVFKYSDNTDNTSNIDTSFGNTQIFANNVNAFIEDEFSIAGNIKINAGLHYSLFFVQDNYYHSLQPRLSARYLMHEKWSLKAAYSTMSQSIHLLTNSGIGLPTDLWLPSTQNVKPQNSNQIAAGIFHNPSRSFEISIEGFYKTMNNLIEYKEGADFFSTVEVWENKIEVGKGRAYGTEFLIRKHKGKTTGWIGYTLSFAERQFDNLNFGNWFPYRYDRRHDIGIALTHSFSETIDMGVVWVYGTGSAISLPIERYPSINNSLMNDPWGYYSNDIFFYDGRNGFRTPAYHRLDASVNMHKEKKWGMQTWSIGVYNLYNRKNPFFLYFSSDYSGNKKLKQISLFPIIPSISYSFKF